MAAAIQRVFVLRFVLSWSRDALFVTSRSEPVHVFDYDGPVLFGRDIPHDGNGRGATYVTWQIVGALWGIVARLPCRWTQVLV